MRSRSSTLLLLCGSLACTGRPEPGEPNRVPEPTPEPVQAAQLPIAEGTSDADACAATMFDHAPGHHDRFVIEDEASGLYGYRNAAGERVIPLRFQFAYPFAPEGVAAVVENGKPEFIDVRGEVLFEAFSYDNGPDYFTEDRARVVVDGKVGFIDRSGRMAVAPRYDYASAFCHGLAVVCNGCVQGVGEHAGYSGGKWGFVDEQGRVAIPLRFDGVDMPFDPDDAVVLTEGRRVRIDRQGRILE
jgi:hypothetical protein